VLPILLWTTVGTAFLSLTALSGGWDSDGGESNLEIDNNKDTADIGTKIKDLQKDVFSAVAWETWLVGLGALWFLRERKPTKYSVGKYKYERR